MRSRKEASRRVRHELGQDVPDSGQEHLAHSDNGFLVTTTSLDAAIAFSKFRMHSGMDERVGHLNQKRFQVRACTGNASGLNICAALVILGQQPAQEHRFLAVGNTDMSPPISERTAIAVIGSLPRPGTVRRSWRISAKGSQMRRISCSRRWRSRRSWSIWSRHWRSFTACSGETAPSTAA